MDLLDKILTNVFKFIFVLAFGLIVGHYLRKCSKIEQKPVIKEHYVRDSIKVTDAEITKVEQKKDSIVKEIKPLKIIAKKKASYFVPTIVNCTFDSTKYLNRIDSLLSLCNKLDTVYQIDSTEIKLLKTQIKQYKNLDTLHINTIDSLVVEIDKQFKKGYIKGVKHSSIVSSLFWLLIGTFVK